MNEQYHLAQINIAFTKAPLTDPLMEEFVDNLEPVNELADNSPGFVWRLQTEEGDATEIQAFENEMIIINMSVWESIESLKAFVYKSHHTTFLQRRQEWFNKLDVYYTLWWIDISYIPTVEEGKERLEYFKTHGDTPYAFTFRHIYSPSALRQNLVNLSP